MTRFGRKIILAGVIVLGAGWWWHSHSTQNKSAGASAPVRVTIATTQRKDVPVDVSLVGTSVPRETVAIKSRLDSQITEVAFHDGDAVKEGQLLFRLDSRDLEAQVKVQQATLAKEKAQLVDTKLQYERMAKLVKTNAVSQAQADDAKAAYQTQEAQVNATQAAVDNTSVQLSYATISAPISGRTGTINVTRGNNVKANDTTALVIINQISPILVQFSIPQRYYDQVRAAMQDSDGLKVEATHVDSTNVSEGKLEYIDNAIDTGTGTFAARATFANGDEKLWPGMFVNLALQLGMQPHVLTIPVEAIQGDEGNHFVFALDKDHKKAVRTPVEAVLIDKIAIITKGLSEGDAVAIDGVLRLTDGAAVEPVPADKPAETGK